MHNTQEELGSCSSPPSPTPGPCSPTASDVQDLADCLDGISVDEPGVRMGFRRMEKTSTNMETWEVG